jgi:hypothetical protein
MVSGHSGRTPSRILAVRSEHYRAFAGVFLGKVGFLFKFVSFVFSYHSLLVTQVHYLLPPPSSHNAPRIDRHPFLPHQPPPFPSSLLPNNVLCRTSSRIPEQISRFVMHFFYASGRDCAQLCAFWFEFYEDIQYLQPSYHSGCHALDALPVCRAGTLPSRVRCPLPLHRVLC